MNYRGQCQEIKLLINILLLNKILFNEKEQTVKSALKK